MTVRVLLNFCQDVGGLNKFSFNGKLQKPPLRYGGSCNYTFKFSIVKIETSNLNKC